MFAGQFSEVKIFRDNLDKIMPTSLFVISGRYGLLSENTSIIPYNRNIESVEELQKINSKTQFTQKIIDLSKNIDFIIFCIPSLFLEFFIAIGFFDLVTPQKGIIIVSTTKYSNVLSKNPKIVLLHRRGVARIGKENQKKIIKIISRCGE